LSKSQGVSEDTHGGFSALVSDVDLSLILADPLQPSDDETVTALAEGLKAHGSALHQRLSVFWGTALSLRGQLAGGRFPPLDRLDLLEHGRLLTGEEARQDLPRPDPNDLLIGGAEFALDYLGGDDTIDELRHPELLVTRGVRRVTKLVLFPVRFLYTSETGQVGTNDAAVAKYVADGTAPATTLVAAALGWRKAPPADELAVSLLSQELISLYLHYIDDHTQRLIALGKSQLASSFSSWRDLLLD
jgi:hypothetical protein